MQGTLFDADMLTAIAFLDTGELWGAMRKIAGLTPDRIAALCCGDTLDADAGRRASPRTRAHLEAEPNGPAMFATARAALLAMAEHIPAFRFARNRPDEFCHGFGMFQYDLQFLKTNPDYFLQRRWWNGPALMRMVAGQTLEAKIGNTVDAVRANGLFRWLRDFGTGFGWHRAATLTDLQEAANAGGVGLIVARRVQDGKSGHIVPVVPETAEHTARRNAAGEVTMLLQSQAGVRNFNYGRSTLNWWTDPKFAEFAFWTHA